MDIYPPSLLDPEVIRQLLRQLETTDVDELEVVDGSSRLFLRREPGVRMLRRGRERAPEGASRSVGVPVVAPLTGVLYMRPSPDQPVFVALGNLVEPGQVVALIETMKLFNEVTTDTGGEILSIAAQEGTLVEAGQPLFYLGSREGSEEP